MAGVISGSGDDDDEGSAGDDGSRDRTDQVGLLNIPLRKSSAGDVGWEPGSLLLRGEGASCDMSGDCDMQRPTLLNIWC